MRLLLKRTLLWHRQNGPGFEFIKFQRCPTFFKKGARKLQCELSNHSIWQLIVVPFSHIYRSQVHLPISNMININWGSTMIIIIASRKVKPHSSNEGTSQHQSPHPLPTDSFIKHLTWGEQYGWWWDILWPNSTTLRTKNYSSVIRTSCTNPLLNIHHWPWILSSLNEWIETESRRISYSGPLDSWEGSATAFDIWVQCDKN